MKIKDILKNKKTTVSFEIFPPQPNTSFEQVESAAKELAHLSPDFMSVTYGAGGGTSSNTVKIASKLQNEMGITAIAHLTCVSSKKEEIQSMLQQIKENNIENILALRGDIPQESIFKIPCEYQYANQLIDEIKSLGDFCIGGACYPEGHTESKTKKDDIKYLKIKVESGCDFLTTQMFFDNNDLYSFLYRIREKGITVPVLAGIMPITNVKQVQRICQISGTYLPSRLKNIIDKFGHDSNSMKQAGIAYATEQIIDLIANDVNGIHIYTMNRPEIAEKIMENISSVIGRK